MEALSTKHWLQIMQDNIYNTSSRSFLSEINYVHLLIVVPLHAPQKGVVESEGAKQLLLLHVAHSPWPVLGHRSVCRGTGCRTVCRVLSALRKWNPLCWVDLNTDFRFETKPLFKPLLAS
jgi:hypothetical protein